MYKTWISLPLDKWQQIEMYGINTTINGMIDLVLEYDMLEEVVDHVTPKHERPWIKRTIVVNNEDYEKILSVYGHRNNQYSLQRLVNLIFDEGLLDDVVTLMDSKKSSESSMYDIAEGTVEMLTTLFRLMPETMTTAALQTVKELQSVIIRMEE